MKWVRLFFLFVFSIILFVSLIFVALSTSAKVGLTHPNKLEGWLSQSNIYGNLQSTITDQAQKSIVNDVTGGSSISKSLVEQAAQSAFTQTLLKQGANEFIDSNYAWLEGKTQTPNFKIDLSNAKTQFASIVAKSSVLAHLKNLPACTAQQAAQLQTSNPLLLSCSPPNFNPNVIADQLSQEVSSSSGFLSNPVITANSLGSQVHNSGEPYYSKLSQLPKGYRIAEKLPWALGVLSILSFLGVILCSQSRRKGIRRATIILLISGLVLIIDKFVTDTVFNHLKGQAFSGVNNAKLEQSLISFAHSIESQLVKIDLYFGVAYIILAVVILLVLLRTRKNKAVKSRKLPSEHIIAGYNPDDTTESKPSDRKHTSQFPRPIGTPQHPQANHQATKKRTGPKPPRLIQ